MRYGSIRLRRRLRNAPHVRSMAAPSRTSRKAPAVPNVSRPDPGAPQAANAARATARMLGQSRAAKYAVVLLRWLDQRNMVFVILFALSPFVRLPSNVRDALNLAFFCIAAPLCVRQIYRLFILAKRAA